MLYTSAEANKLLKKIESRLTDLQRKESRTATFNVASGEDVESLRPPYDFAETQAKIAELQAKAIAVKHAINIFNTTHTLPGFGDMTIDQALVRIPQLSGQVSKLSGMAAVLPKMRIDHLRSNIIDYQIANYDIEEVETAYVAAQDELAKLQLALDAVNNSETMEIDIELD